MDEDREADLGRAFDKEEGCVKFRVLPTAGVGRWAVARQASAHMHVAGSRGVLGWGTGTGRRALGVDVTDSDPLRDTGGEKRSRAGMVNLAFLLLGSVTSRSSCSSPAASQCLNARASFAHALSIHT